MLKSSWRGLAAMTAAMALFAANDALVKFFASNLPVAQSIAIRGAVATIATLGLIAALGRWRVVVDAANPIVVTRALAECFAIFCLITALTQAPIGDVTAISQMTPLMLLPMAALIYGESVGLGRWALVLLGFLGVVLIARPGQGGFNPVILLAVLTAAGFAARDLLAPRIRANIPALAVTLSTLIVVAAVGGAVGLARGFEPVATAQVIALGGAGLLLSLGQALIYLAFRWAPVSDVSPFNYTKTVFGLIAGIVAFGDWPGPATLLGAALVVASGVGVALSASAKLR